MLDTNMLYTELAEVTAMEKHRKEMGWSEAQFYACPSLKKLPIFDEAHVRTSMSRFGQVEGLSLSDRASVKANVVSAAKKFGVKADEFAKLGEELVLTDKSYVIKKAKLMSEGKWNDNFYSKAEIKKAFDSTDWSYPNNRYLYLEHKDGGVGDWIGEVVNPYFDGDSLYGDVAFHNPIWAASMRNGKPRFGISPRLRGDIHDNKQVKDFLFENFSLVLNPAVKTTFFNNAAELEGSDFEKPVGVSEERLKEIIGQELSEIDVNNQKVEQKEEVKSMDGLADLFELYELKGLNLAKITRKAADLRSGEASLSEIDAIKRAAKLLEEEEATRKMAEAAAKASEVKKESVADAELSELKKQVKELSEKLNEPATKVVKTLEEQVPKNVDECLIKYLNDLEVNSSYVQ